MEETIQGQATTQEAEPLDPGVTAADAGQTAEGAEDSRPSWEEILADPAYKSRYDAAVQDIVQRRLRGRHEAEERLARLEPVLQALREVYGADPADSEALCREIYRHGAESILAGKRVRSHWEALLQESEALRRRLPDFDLERELGNPVFLRLTAPHSGVGLEDAYYALHREQIGRAAAEKSLAAFSRSMDAQARRPREIRAEQHGTTFSRDAKSMSRAEREALKQRILEAKAQGRKLGVGE